MVLKVLDWRVPVCVCLLLTGCITHSNRPKREVLMEVNMEKLTDAANQGDLLAIKLLKQIQEK
jgi:hypothetical protein